MDEKELTYLTRKCIFEVHKELGPGLFESVYEAALMHEFWRIGLKAQSQIPIPVFYKGNSLDMGFILDILVEDQLILELKSVEYLRDVHKKQLLTYLRLTNRKIGMLINFNSTFLISKESIIRIVN